MTEYSQMVILHIIAATPPTLAACAALVTSLRSARTTREIHVLVNGERAKLQLELEHARAQLGSRGSMSADD